jgi:zona occludens toxin
MSIKIHHGPPGTYKTSGAVQDDLLPLLNSKKKEIRPIVTNIRGLTREKILEAKPELPESIQVINIDTSTEEGMEKISKWFHWVPLGAFIILDEGQVIFPKEWTAKHIKELDYPGGREKAKNDGRPVNWMEAWTQHRHYNWDIVITTPSIKYLRDDIRNTAETAFKHANLALIKLPGLKGKYKESVHMATDNGSPSTCINVRSKRINNDVFKLYSSTSTGEFSDTVAGVSILSDPRLLLLFGTVLAAGYFGVSGFSNSFLVEDRPESATKAIVDQRKNEEPGVISDKENTPVHSLDVAPLRTVTTNILPGTNFLKGQTLDINGVYKLRGIYHYTFSVKKGEIFYTLNQSDLLAMGYKVIPAGRCGAVLSKDERNYPVTCGDRSKEVKEEEKSERG